MDTHLYAVIMAGGIGSRLWPRSLKQAPKQFLDLLGPHTLLQETVQRIEPLVPLSRLLVVTGHDYVQTVLDQVPGLPAENVLAEPGRRNTAPGVGLAAAVIQRRDAAATMVTLWADHYVADPASFRQAVTAAACAAAGGYLVALGITPTEPSTGFGYIQRAAALDGIEGLPAYEVQRFTEKPDEATARRFVDSGEYYWNAGMFVWRVDRILAEIARLLPSLDAELRSVAGAWDTPSRATALASAWERVPRTSIDFGVMEKASRVAVVPVEMGWDDVGTWATLSHLQTQHEGDNQVHGPGRHLLMDTTGTYVYTSDDRLVAAIGLHDLVIVDTPNALLVCHKSQAQAVKTIVEKLEADGLDQYL